MRNIAGHLKDASEFIQRRAVRNFFQVDREYGERISRLLEQYKVGKTLEPLDDIEGGTNNNYL